MHEVLVHPLTVNVLRLVGRELADSQFTVGRLGSAVTTRKVINDESSELVAANSFQVLLDNRDTGTGVASVCLAQISKWFF